MLSLRNIICTIFIFSSYSLSLKAEQQSLGDRVFTIGLAHQRGGTIIDFTKEGRALVKWDLPEYGVGTLETTGLSPYLQIGALAKVKYSYNRFLNTIYSYGYDIIYINTVGKIEKIEGSWITIREASGKLIQVPRNAITRVTLNPIFTEDFSQRTVLCAKSYSH